jgi:serine/threonine protein kinase
MSQARRELEERDADRWREALVGTVVAGKYSVTRLIGRGGMGAVFEAEHLGIGRKVALKFLDRAWVNDENVASRFAREARAVTGIDSDHVVSVFDAGTDGKQPFLVMELLRGEDLGKRLRRDKRVPLDQTLHMAAQVLRGLVAAHAAGIVHRDLKPENVFLSERADDPAFVKIVDFGISKIERPKSGTAPLALTQKGVVIGTPLYMSPEQAQALRDLDGRADLFSLGAIVFECLSGRPPHVGETYEQIIVSICIQDAPDIRAIVPSTPDGVALFIARALERDRAKRFASAYEMLGALRLLAPNDSATRPLSITAPAREANPANDPSVASGVFPPRPGGATGVSWADAGRPPTSSEPRLRRSTPRAPLMFVAAGAMVLGIGLTLFALESSRPAAVAPAALPSASTKTATASSSANAATTATPITTTTTTRTASSSAIPTPSGAPSAPPRRVPARPAAQGDLQLQREAP